MPPVKKMRFRASLKRNSGNPWKGFENFHHAEHREITGSVVLEAMSRTLPVVTVKVFGASTIVDEECGWLYEGTRRDDYIEN